MENEDSGGDGHARIAALMASVMQLEAEAQEAKYEADAAEDRMVRMNGVIAACRRRRLFVIKTGKTVLGAPPQTKDGLSARFPNWMTRRSRPTSECRAPRSASLRKRAEAL
ncbi:hypothetical protein HPB48_003004 [Haemaphysalis longicornis]|uniref:Uncharacterized protein n=1 Tax=Haemaphysalis longicornis TaxID=44386 RepID=A0A9J6F750_HAELO|nr:hypothetical protein HPB48_003004 [Haemaphysalis longicornis]